MSEHTAGGKMPLDDFKRGYLWLLMHYACSCVVYVVSKYILLNIEFSDFAFWWFGSGLAFHGLYCLATGRLLEEKVDGHHARVLLLYAFLDASGSAAFYLSVQLMHPSIVSFLNQSQILMAIFFGYIFLKEILNRSEIGAALVIIAGLVVMTYHSDTIPTAGFLLMLYANCAGAGTLILVRKIGVTIGTLTFARIRTLSIFMVFLIYNLAIERSISLPAMPILYALIVGGLFGPVLNVIAVFNSLKYIPAGRLALFRSIIPVFVMITDVAVLGLFPGVRETIGGVIILAGTMLLAYFYMGNVPPLKRPIRPLR